MPTTDSSHKADRLFSEPIPAFNTQEGRRAWIEKVLEEGDSRDLRQILARVSEQELSAWLAEYGGRRLSQRSRVFWSLVLDCPLPPPHPLTEDIWPL